MPSRNAPYAHPTASLRESAPRQRGAVFAENSIALTRLIVFLFALLTSARSCDDGTLLIVSVSGLDDSIVKLSVNITLNGRMTTEAISQHLDYFGLRLDAGVMGTVTLDVDALNNSGQAVLHGQGSKNLNGDSRVYVDISLGNLPPPPPCYPPNALCMAYPLLQSNNLWSMWMIADNDIWAVGDNGTAVHYDGTSWQTATTPTTNRLTGVWGSATNNLWAVGFGGVILHYDGTKWTQVLSPTNLDLWSIFGTSSTDIWAVGKDPPTLGSTILHYNGMKWSGTNAPIGGALYGVWANSPTVAYACGAKGYVFRWNGTSWSNVNTPIVSDLYAIWGAGPSQVVAIGVGGTVLRYSTATSFVTVTNSAIADLLSVWGTGPNGQVYAVGSNGSLVRGTSPTATMWTSLTSNTTLKLHAIQTNSSGVGWVAGDNGALFRFVAPP